MEPVSREDGKFLLSMYDSSRQTYSFFKALSFFISYSSVFLVQLSLLAVIGNCNKVKR